jgi:hypothetical protein
VELSRPRAVVVEVFDGYMVVADLPTPWADSRHLLWEVAPAVWRENVTACTFPG